MAGTPVAGRDTAGRVVDAGTTASNTALSGAGTALYTSDDVGRTVTGVGVPAGTTVASVSSATAAVLSAQATVTDSSVLLTLGPGVPATFGYFGWAPETLAEQAVYTIAGGAGATSPDRLADSVTPVVRRRRVTAADA